MGECKQSRTFTLREMSSPRWANTRCAAWTAGLGQDGMKARATELREVQLSPEVLHLLPFPGIFEAVVVLTR